MLWNDAGVSLIQRQAEYIASLKGKTIAEKRLKKRKRKAETYGNG